MFNRRVCEYRILGIFFPELFGQTNFAETAISVCRSDHQETGKPAYDTFVREPTGSQRV